MAGKFHVLTTPAFDRQARKAVRNKQELTGVLEEILIALRFDPHNRPGRIHGDLSSRPPAPPLPPTPPSREKAAAQDDDSFVSYVYERLTS